MLSARRTSDGQTVHAYFESSENGPFRCLECNEELLLKMGLSRINHFAHRNLRCAFSQGESEEHRRCKMEIYESLLRDSRATEVALERPFGASRPDVSAVINGVHVAIEVQISSLSIETIMRRTIEYAQNDISVLWLLQWTPDLDSPRFCPSKWERWIHAAYFGRVYFWKSGLEILSYQFEPVFKSVPKATWHSRTGRKITGVGFTKRMKRFKTAVCNRTLHLTRDFGTRQRYWWEGNGITVPDARLFMDSH